MDRGETSPLTPGVTHSVPTAVGTEWVMPGDEIAIMVAILDIGIEKLEQLGYKLR